MPTTRIVLDERRLQAVIHALQEAHDHVEQAGGDCYGPLSLAELHGMIEQMHVKARIMQSAEGMARNNVRDARD